MITKKTLRILLFFSLLCSVTAQTVVIQDSPWNHPEPEENVTRQILEIYFPVEFLGGNPLNFGAGCALWERKLDIQFQGGFSYYEWEEYSSLTDDYNTYGYTLGGDISHHIPIAEGPWGVYYGLLYRYNHIENLSYTAFDDIHWTGLSVGTELQRERLTFYLEGLFFLKDFYLDFPHMSFTGGLKFWVY